MRWFIIYLLFFFANSIGYACTIKDDTGQSIILSHPAERIISLAPNLTELLFAIDAGNRIVGVASHSDFPEAAKKIPVVAGYSSLNLEAIIASHPDLVIAWEGGNPRAALKKIQQAGIPVYFSAIHKLTDIPKTLRRLGCLTGTAAMAERAATQFLQRYQQLQQLHQKSKVVTVFYEIWPKPLMTISKVSLIDEIIRLCGGKNIFAETKGVTPVVTREAVLQKNPQVIFGEKLDEWNKWPDLEAVRYHQLFIINPGYLQRAAPRILQGADQVCAILDSVRHFYV